MSDAEPKDVGEIGIRDGETDIEKWEAIGRELLRRRLNSAAGDATGTFGEVAAKIDRGEEPTKDDVEKLYAEVENLKFAVETLAEIVPGSRRKDLNEYMTGEELEAVADRARNDQES
ncbi:MAG: hypothetical protein ACOCZD_00135 [Haloferacaceae archaeon]